MNLKKKLVKLAKGDIIDTTLAHWNVDSDKEECNRKGHYGCDDTNCDCDCHRGE